MDDVFFVLSGEHPTLPWAELRSVLEAEAFPYVIKENRGQVVRLKVDERVLARASSRCGMTRTGCVEISISGSSSGEILKTLDTVDFKSSLKERDKRMAVRVLRLGKVSGERIEPLEREIGRLVISRVPSLKVDLKNPQIVLIGVLGEDFFLLGVQKGPIQKKSFFQRRPRKRPFFHATAMSVKLSRCMVNLTRSKSCALILDPFCGTGSMLLEAGLMGFRIVGGDIQRRMVAGAYANLKYFGLDPGLIVHDARRIPFRFADCVVADPPYGRSATTLGLDAREVLKVFFQELTSTLAKGGYVCLAFPRELDVKEIGMRSGFEFVESHLLYVHKSLTREIAVFRKSN